jgi:hypothetical protein
VFEDRVDQRGEGVGVAESAGLDRVEYPLQCWVEAEAISAVEMGVAEILDVFGKVAEEEDVVFTDFASNLRFQCQ